MPKISKSGIGCFARNKRGNVAILFGLAIIPMVLAIGAAVDYGRALMVRERMADAADASALAIGSWTNLTEAEMKAKAQQYFDANYSTSSIGSPSAIKVSFPGDDIIVSVSGTVPTTFMRLANINSVDVGASATVTKRQRNIELALVLDTTGSMDRDGKMSSMQSAAKAMVKELFGANSTSDTLTVAVVPFAGAVNVGSDNKSKSWIDKNAQSKVAQEDFGSGVKAFDLYDDIKKGWSWAGCVRERSGSAYELTDATPGTGDSLFAPYLAPDEPDEDYADDDDYDNSYIEDDQCGQSKKKKRTPAACQKYTGKYNGFKKDDSKAAGPNWNCPPAAITALSNSKSTVTSAISALEPNGFTVIPAGLLWGWRVLSPGEPFAEGKPYDENERVKAIVLLTDGTNEVGSPNYNQNGSAYNAFGFAAKGHLGVTNGSGAYKELNSKAATVCSNIKAKGILIYTIGFRVTDTTTQNLLKNCATKPDMYYNSPSNNQLAAIFNDIALGLSELRIAY